MPRYYFHVRYGREVIRDENGDELPDDQAALERAVEAARAFLRAAPDGDDAWSRCVFEVTNRDGAAVWRMPVRDAVEAVGD